MRTYAKKCGLPEFDWNEFLDRAIKEKIPVYADAITLHPLYRIASAQASSWVTCACGNQCSVIPRRNTEGAPKDKKLLVLGIRFSHSINDGSWQDAKCILKEIEERSAQLIKEQGVIRRILSNVL